MYATGYHDSIDGATAALPADAAHAVSESAAAGLQVASQVRAKPAAELAHSVQVAFMDGLSTSLTIGALVVIAAAAIIAWIGPRRTTTVTEYHRPHRRRHTRTRPRRLQLVAEHLLIIGQGRILADTSMDDFIEHSLGGVVVASPDAGVLASLLAAHGATLTSTEAGRFEVRGLPRTPSATSPPDTGSASTSWPRSPPRSSPPTTSSHATASSTPPPHNPTSHPAPIPKRAAS